MKNSFTLFLFLAPFMLSSCHSQDNKLVDLGKISNDFKVSDFYESRVEKTQEIISKDPKSVDRKEALKLLNTPFFAKDTLGYYETGGRFPTKLYLEPTNDWMVRNKKPTELFGYRYKTAAYDPDKDTIAILNTVPFPKMDMVEDTKGDLMYLEVGKTSKNTTDLNKIKDYISKNCKSIKVEDGDEGDAYWEDQRFYYCLSSRESKEEEILSYDALGNKETRMINVTEISLTMFEKSYIKKMEDLRIYSAGWELWKKR